MTSDNEFALAGSAYQMGFADGKKARGSVLGVIAKALWFTIKYSVMCAGFAFAALLALFLLGAVFQGNQVYVTAVVGFVICMVGLYALLDTIFNLEAIWRYLANICQGWGKE